MCCMFFTFWSQDRVFLAERKQSASNLGNAIWHQSGFRPNLGSWKEKAPIWQVPIWQKKCHYLGRPIWQFRTKKPIWKKGQSGNMKPLPRKYLKFTFSVSNLWQRPIWQAKPIWKCRQSGAEKLNTSIWKWIQSGRDPHGISIWIHGQSGNLHQSGFGPNLANIISTKRSQSGLTGNLEFYISQSKPNLV